MIRLQRSPDGHLSFDGRPVLTEDFGTGRRPPYAWRALMRPWDHMDMAESDWLLRSGRCYLIPYDGPEFSRARVVTEAEVQLVDVGVAS